eukprot:8599575-Karenia_brevis.AAC.1
MSLKDLDSNLALELLINWASGLLGAAVVQKIVHAAYLGGVQNQNVFELGGLVLGVGIPAIKPEIRDYDS